MLTQEEKRRLIAAARDAIAAALAGHRHEPAPPAEGALAEHRGAFVTLRSPGHRLRGCVGYPEAAIPLLRVVAEVAPKAALQDHRFTPVREEELGGLEVEVSVLTPFTRATGPGDIVIGRDGLVIEAGGRRGLLLPQVAVEYGWDPADFLEAVCEKAGLPPGAWRRADAQLFRFGAEVVEEADVTS
jgi:AmmeMemoRadiSam system protein A